MSAQLGFAAARRQSRASLLAAWLDGGTISVYAGTRPASADDAITTQTLIAAFGLPTPAGSAADGVWTADPLPPNALILADGTATWARVRDSAAAVICDLDVGATDSGEALELDDTACVAGAYLIATALTITEG
jgi:hypothetical protein